MRAVNRPVHVVTGWLEPRHYVGAAQRSWHQANRWRTVSFYARDVRQRGAGHAAAWLDLHPATSYAGTTGALHTRVQHYLDAWFPNSLLALISFASAAVRYRPTSVLALGCSGLQSGHQHRRCIARANHPRHGAFPALPDMRLQKSVAGPSVGKGQSVAPASGASRECRLPTRRMISAIGMQSSSMNAPRTRKLSLTPELSAIAPMSGGTTIEVNRWPVWRRPTTAPC